MSNLVKVILATTLILATVCTYANAEELNSEVDLKNSSNIVKIHDRLRRLEKNTGIEYLGQTYNVESDSLSEINSYKIERLYKRLRSVENTLELDRNENLNLDIADLSRSSYLSIIMLHERIKVIERMANVN